MKGIVFTEFLDMIDEKFGMEVTEDVINNVSLPSGGAYTSVGTYHHSEIIIIVGELSSRTGLAVPALVQTFGHHLLGRFYEMFPAFFSDLTDVTAFLENVDGYIHGEVRKLYPDATLPEILTKRLADGNFELIYKSERKMGDLAEGLIAGAIEHFGNTHKLDMETLPQEGARQCLRFLLTPVH